MVFLMELTKQLKHSDPDAGSAPNGYVLNSIDTKNHHAATPQIAILPFEQMRLVYLSARMLHPFSIRKLGALPPECNTRFPSKRWGASPPERHTRFPSNRASGLALPAHLCDEEQPLHRRFARRPSDRPHQSAAVERDSRLPGGQC